LDRKDRKTVSVIPAGAKTIEMADGRVYYSLDNWHTVYRARPNRREVKGEEANQVRLLVAYGAAG
jgi:hypothetical protein